LAFSAFTATIGIMQLRSAARELPESLGITIVENSMRALPRICAALVSLVCVATTARAASYVVNSVLDLPDADPSDSACATAPPNPVCTLRAAVMQANASAGEDTIVLSNTTYVLTRVGYDQTASLGDLDVTDRLIIQGNGATIDANGGVTADRAFEVVSGSLRLWLQDMTVRNGATPGYGGAIYANDYLRLDGVDVVSNAAGLDGGGIYATDDLTVNSSLIADNTSQGSQGGGIALHDAGTKAIELSASEIARNHVLGASGSGGGIALDDALTFIDHTWVHDNSSADRGGGLYYHYSAFAGVKLGLDTSVFDHNSSTIGGNLYLDGNDQIHTTTVSRGSANIGGGIYATNGTHELTDVGVSGNESTGSGGGILVVQGDLDVLRGSIDHNIAATSGGGMAATGIDAHSLTITDASVHDNRSTQDGGGIWSEFATTVRTSAVYKNRGARGGGLFVLKQLDVDDSILDGNAASSNGGAAYIDSGASVRFSSSTISANYARVSYPKAGTGAGLYVDPAATARAKASVFAYNNNSSITIAPNDCYGTLHVDGYVFLSTNASCSVVADFPTGNQIGGTYPDTIDPLLGALQPLYDPLLPPAPTAHAKFGRAPLTGSALINAGPFSCSAGDGTGLASDEIGQVRNLGGTCDIGAVEYGAAGDRVFAGTFDA